MSLNFVAVDFETANQHHASICAMGLVKVSDGEIAARFSTPIRPPHGLDYFSEINTHIHGMTKEDIKTAPILPMAFLSAYTEYMPDNEVFVAHRASSADMSMLRKGLGIYDIPMPPNSWLDSWEIAKRYVPGLKNYKLTTVAKELGVYEKGHHDPVVDAEMSARIVLEIARLNGIDSIYEFNATVLHP